MRYRSILKIISTSDYKDFWSWGLGNPGASDNFYTYFSGVLKDKRFADCLR